MAATALSTKQLTRFKQHWSQWHATHELASQALSSAVNIHSRLQDILDPEAYPLPPSQQMQQLEQIGQEQGEQPEQPWDQQQLQNLVVCKQMASMDKALSLMRGHHKQLQQLVRDMERLYIEASRALNLSGSALTAAAAPQGPTPSLLQVVEAMQDTWVMCRDELLLKVAIVGLVSLDATPLHMATLMQCYRDQPNIHRAKTDAILGLLQETMPQDKV